MFLSLVYFSLIITICYCLTCAKSHPVAGCPRALRETRYKQGACQLSREATSLAIAKAKRLKKQTVLVFLEVVKKKLKQESPIIYFSAITLSVDRDILLDTESRHCKIHRFPADVVITSKCPDITAISNKRGVQFKFC